MRENNIHFIRFPSFQMECSTKPYQLVPVFLTLEGTTLQWGFLYEHSLSLNTGNWKRLKGSLFSRDLTTISIGLQCVFLSHWRNVHWIVKATLLPWKIDMGMTIADKNVEVRKEPLVLRSHFWQITACLILHKTATRWTIESNIRRLLCTVT